MTVEEIIREVEALPIEARREIVFRLQVQFQNEDEESKPYYEVNGIRFAKFEVVRPIMKRIFEEHKELFQKLAE